MILSAGVNGINRLVEVGIGMQKPCSRGIISRFWIGVTLVAKVSDGVDLLSMKLPKRGDA